MVEDFNKYLGPKPMENPRFDEYLAYQTWQRSLNEAAIIAISNTGQVTISRGVNYYDGLIDQSRLAQALAQLKGKPKPRKS